MADIRDDQQPQPSLSADDVHVGVECDECGENPIVGTRFKCTTRRNYDICRRCWQDNHAATMEGFVQFGLRVPLVQTRRLEPESAKRSIRVYSLFNLTYELHSDPTIEDVTFYPQNSVESEDRRKAAIQAIAQHKGMKTFHLYTRGARNVDMVVHTAAEGLRYNKSVFSVGFSITTNTRHQNLSKEATQALKELVEQNHTIRFFFVKRPRAIVMDRLSVKTEEDDLEDAMFDSLTKSSLETFRFEPHRPVSDKNKKKAWQAMEHNPKIRRICTKFANPDNHLEILGEDKKRMWMKRWAAVGNSNKERLNVLEEIRGSHLEDVPVLFRLIRGQPECLLGVQE